MPGGFRECLVEQKKSSVKISEDCLAESIKLMMSELLGLFIIMNLNHSV